MPERTRVSAWSRREFLRTAAAGAALVAVPGWLAGCAPRTGLPSGALPPDPPATPAGYFALFGIDEALLRRVVDRAMARGADYADLFFQHRVRNTLGLEDGQVDRASSEVDLGCGVRVLKGEQTGFAFTEDLSPEALLAAAATAAFVADGPSRPLLAGLRRAMPAGRYYPIEVPFDAVGIDRKVPLLARADAAARAVDPRVVKVRATMLDSASQILLASSDGLVVEDAQPMAELWVTCTAEEGGRREEGWKSRAARSGFEFYAPRTVEDVAEEAARSAARLLGAGPVPSGSYPVVLAPGLSGILLHEAIGHGMEADFNRTGRSVYADRLGSRIAPELVTIVDDATLPAARGSLNVDDEGADGARTVLVERGILRSYMHDRISSAHYRLAPTGNGRRECYRFPPVPRMRNTYMLDGPHTRDEIVRSVKKGLYAEVFLNGEVRIGSGDFTFYLKSGTLIEDGKLTRPVKDANLIGFGPDVLAKVEMVGNDLAMYSGAGYCGKDGQLVPVGFGLPTLKCAGISVGGVGA